MNHETDTPRTDCPDCGAKYKQTQENELFYECGTSELEGSFSRYTHREDLCYEREKSQKLEAEVERLRELLEESLGIEYPPKMHRPNWLICQEYKSIYFTNDSKNTQNTQEDDK